MARAKVADAVGSLNEMSESGIVGWEFYNDKKLSFDVRQLVPVDWTSLSMVARKALSRGIFEKVRDTYAGSKGNPDVAYEKAAGAIEFLEAGEWTKQDREPGVRLSDFFEAVNRMREAKGDARLSTDELKAKYTGSDEAIATRESHRANAKIQAHMADIALEKAQKRAEEKKAAAASASDIDI